ncbi:hypothetical protein Pla175_15630 [Pirellulimonas nuda]|uniref:Uncharacterized protein n=1 Tax=Pirellulimonas nuda TaxID=2528009 RepID=A0A518D9N1_9BACT|nr:hypothetical protein [Pirellulimonas nuda]QDU88191.1 hypothetical protein Pla175_15630 [Pirellulimonas nuda]
MAIANTAEEARSMLLARMETRLQSLLSELDSLNQRIEQSVAKLTPVDCEALGRAQAA